MPLRTPIAAALAIGLTAACGHAQTETGPDFAALEAAIPGWLDEHGVPAVGVAYVRDGEVVWSGSWGEQAPGSPADAQTRFNIASLTKPVAAETVLRLAAQGRVELDAPMASDWVDPDVAGDPRHESLTAFHALAHQSGFPNWRYMNEDGRLAFRYAPGEGAGYSGEGYAYAARYAEARTGTPFAALAGETVFAPAGMDSAGWAEPGCAEHCTVPMGPEGEFGEPQFSDPYSAADDLYVTPADYGRFIASMMRADGLNPELAARRDAVQTDQTEQVCNPQGPFVDICPERAGFGLGRVVFEYPGETVIWHGGGDWGDRSLMAYSPQTGTGFVILANGANGGRLFPLIAAEFTGNEDFLGFLRIQAERG